MIENYNQLWSILLGAGTNFLILFLLYRKHILHLFDPLFLYVVAQSFTIQFAFMTIDNTYYLINFLGCEVCFITAFLIMAGRPLAKADFNSSVLFKKLDYYELSVLKWYAIFGLLFLIAANIIFIKVNGLIILADDPSAAKVDSYTKGNGLGIVKRLNFGLLYFVGISTAIMFLVKNKLRYILLFFLLIVITSLGGSKGALFYFIALIAFLGCFNDLKKNNTFRTLKIACFFILILAVFLIAFLISSGNSGDTLQDKLFKLVTRFLFFGDAIMYYYNPSSIQYFSHNNIINFFSDEFNSILGLFRLVPYKLPMGFNLINYYYNVHSETFGPNTPYYIKGNIYFGYYGSFIYSAVVGSIIGFVRRQFYALVRNGSSSIIYSLIIIHINLGITTFAQDSQLFISELSDTFFLSLPILAGSLLLHWSEKTYLLKSKLQLKWSAQKM